MTFLSNQTSDPFGNFNDELDMFAFYLSKTASRLTKKPRL